MLKCFLRKIKIIAKILKMLEISSFVTARMFPAASSGKTQRRSFEALSQIWPTAIYGVRGRSRALRFGGGKGVEKFIFHLFVKFRRLRCRVCSVT